MGTPFDWMQYPDPYVSQLRRGNEGAMNALGALLQQRERERALASPEVQAWIRSLTAPVDSAPSAPSEPLTSGTAQAAADLAPMLGLTAPPGGAPMPGMSGQLDPGAAAPAPPPGVRVEVGPVTMRRAPKQGALDPMPYPRAAVRDENGQPSVVFDENGIPTMRVGTDAPRMGASAGRLSAPAVSPRQPGSAPYMPFGGGPRMAQKPADLFGGMLSPTGKGMSAAQYEILQEMMPHLTQRLGVEEAAAGRKEAAQLRFAHERRQLELAKGVELVGMLNRRAMANQDMMTRLRIAARRGDGDALRNLRELTKLFQRDALTAAKARQDWLAMGLNTVDPNGFAQLEQLESVNRGAYESVAKDFSSLVPRGGGAQPAPGDMTEEALSAEIQRLEQSGTR